MDSNHDFRVQSAASCHWTKREYEIVKELAAGERFERPYPDSKSRVLPLDDPASRFQRYCFHAPHTQHGRFIEVVAKLFAINASTVRKLVMISAAIAIQLRRNLDLKTVESIVCVFITW